MGYVCGVKATRTDYRPGRRNRRVPPPSGTPRRIPLLRLLLLAGLGAYLYASFDDLWPRVRAAVQPAAWWNAVFAGSDADAEPVSASWSGDSSRVVVQCPQGFDAACCGELETIQPGICGTTRALRAKAVWKKAVAVSETSPLSVEAGAVVSELGEWGYELKALRGRDASGAWHFRRQGTASFCDTRRGCLGDRAPRAPLADARLHAPAFTIPDAPGTWVSSSARVRAALPGRITAVDSVPGGGVRVRVYHGSERYIEYGPLHPVPGVEPGVLVRTGSLLGNAPSHAGRHRLDVRVRQAGSFVPAERFWNVTAMTPDLSDASMQHVDAPFAPPQPDGTEAGS